MEQRVQEIPQNSIANYVPVNSLWFDLIIASHVHAAVKEAQFQHYKDRQKLETQIKRLRTELKNHKETRNPNACLYHKTQHKKCPPKCPRKYIPTPVVDNKTA